MFSPKIASLAGIGVFVLITIILYWRYFLFGEIPMPGDTLIGAYFPWLDYKWGFAVGVPVKNALISDVFSQFFLWKYLIVDIFKTGQIPLWNIYSLSGTPIMATYHSSVFNPFNILLFLPKFYGWGLYVCLQTLFAMVGMYFLLGMYTKNFYPRVLGGLVFGLSGLMTTWVEFGTGVWAAGSLPWIFLFLERYLNSLKLRNLFFMSTAFIILYLSGHAQLTLYSTILTMIFIAVKFLKSKKLTQLLWPSLFILLSIVICSFQFLPTIEFTKNSIREAENYSSSFNYGLNPLYEVVKFFSADFFGNPTTGNYWDAQSYHEQSIFLGTIPFVLILSFIIYSFRKKQYNFWISVFLSTLVLGFENPISKFIYSLPLPFLTYSSAARIFFLTSFSGGILTSLALEKLSDQNYRKYFIRTNIFFLAAVSGIFTAFVGLSIFLKNHSDLEQLNVIVANFNVTIKNLIIPIGVSIFLLSILFLSRYTKTLKNLVIILIIAVTFFELSRYFYKYNPFIAGDLVFPATPAIEFLQKQPGLFRIARGDREVMPPNTWMYYKLQSIEGYDPLLSKDYAKVFNLINGFDFNATPSRYRELEKYDSKFINALNVRYFLTVKRDSEGKVKGDFISTKLTDAGYKIIFEDGNTAILENPNAQPRAYFAKNLKEFLNEADLVNTLTDRNFNPQEEALIVSDKDFGVITDNGSVEISSYTANKISLKTNSSGNAFLIVSDSFDNGWKLYRDGAEEILFKTNYAFRGMFVPAGESNFDMIYSPNSFKYGIWLSLLGFFGFVMIFFYSIYRKNI